MWENIFSEKWEIILLETILAVYDVTTSQMNFRLNNKYIILITVSRYRLEIGMYLFHRHLRLIAPYAHDPSHTQTKWGVVRPCDLRKACDLFMEVTSWNTVNYGRGLTNSGLERTYLPCLTLSVTPVDDNPLTVKNLLQKPAHSHWKYFQSARRVQQECLATSVDTKHNFRLQDVWPGRRRGLPKDKKTAKVCRPNKSD